MKGKEVTLFLAGGFTLNREALAAARRNGPGVRVVGQEDDGRAVVDGVKRLSPDVVMLDVTMPGLNGLDVCREISRKCKNSAVLILTMHDDEQFIATTLENGASGYLLKEAATDELCEAVRKVAGGELYLGTGIPCSAVKRAVRGNEDPYDRLTTRERQVLQLIAEGKTNRDIADELNLAVKTVDTHRSRLRRKLNIQDQPSLVRYAQRRTGKFPGGEAGSLSASDKDRPHGGKLGAVADSPDTLPQASGNYSRKDEEPPQLPDGPVESGGRQVPAKPRLPRNSSTIEEVRQWAAMHRLRSWIAKAMDSRDDLDPATLQAVLDEMDRIRQTG